MNPENKTINPSTTQYLALVFIIFLVFAFRIGELDVMPQWFWDEGVNLNLVCNLLSGDARIFGLEYSFIPHPPLYFLLGVVWNNLLGFGCALSGLRWLSVLLGVLSILLLYSIGNRLGGIKIGLLASFLYAIFPAAVYWHRLAFANHLLAFLLLLSFLSWIEFSITRNLRWLWLSCFSAGLSLVTEYTGVAVAVSVTYLLWRFERRLLWKGFALIALPVLVFVAFMLSWRMEFFIHDFFNPFTNLPGTPLNQTVLVVALFFLFYLLREKIIHILKSNIGQMLYFSIRYRNPDTRKKIISQDFYLLLSILYLVLSLTTLLAPSDESFLYGIDFYWLGVLGLIFFSSVRHITLAFFLPIFLVTLKIGRTDHMIIPLYPFFVLGLVFLITSLYQFWKRHISEKRSTLEIVRPALLIFLLGFIATSFYHDANLFVLGEEISKTSPENYLEVAKFLNPILQSDDVVVANSNFPRFIDGNVCILTLSIAREGGSIAYYPPLPEERFVFDCSFSRVDYFVLEEKTLDWLDNQSRSDLKGRILAMPVIFEHEQFKIYENI
ncbi:ArnT family glycosyltransferase [Candidatus Altiarchaeota archaeon]